VNVNREDDAVGDLVGFPDLSVPTQVHVIGIGGAGMSAIAEVLTTMGHRISGSDLKASAGLERLRALGVEVYIGHDAAQVGDAEYVTRSTAIPDSNPECIRALEEGRPLLSRAQMLGAITRFRRTVAVAGTHGKTTTASMLALALRGADLRPSFVIGGDVNEIGTGAAWDDGDLFVVEADESDGSFLELAPRLAVVTNVDPDHLEYHGSFEALRVSFDHFTGGVDGPVVIGIDDVEGAALADRARRAGVDVRTVGTAADADWSIGELRESWEGVSFILMGPTTASDPRLSITLPVPGLHNARNAASAAVLALLVGAEPDSVADALARFGGVARRFEQRGRVAGVVLVDDYAHLPAEVVATVRAARSGNFARLVAVFQPHRFSRTEALWSSFGSSFEGVDVLFVTDVYPSGEAPRPGVSGHLLVEAVQRDLPHLDVRYTVRRDDLLDALMDELRPGDLCLTMGAGDLTSVPTDLRTRLSDKEIRKGVEHA
jgi:UDP-N-acetylmuramate--alanine ligase|tara:strand:+ start:207 stop:1673 length:1467 start_codon:yes stop_codon:yes gene_type:complete